MSEIKAAVDVDEKILIERKNGTRQVMCRHNKVGLPDDNMKFFSEWLVHDFFFFRKINEGHFEVVVKVLGCNHLCLYEGDGKRTWRLIDPEVKLVYVGKNIPESCNLCSTFSFSELLCSVWEGTPGKGFCPKQGSFFV